ncbi:MAG: HAMP domain-containing histidine kinase, partial [Sneathiella sp.]|nr:HAMP domain-containing histidine kinase [Sneathiella sp.]
LILGAGVVLWVGISRGFRPLLKLEEALNRRTQSDLRPILHEVPQEVRHLVGAINSLMLRLGNSIEAMQRFTSNAAHQLRTPLAGIQTQADLALTEEDPEELKKRLDHLRESTYQSTHLIQQLLSLARATPVDGDLEFNEINLADICREVTADLVPKAISHNMDLGCESDEAELPIKGQQGLLEEALRNLINNALTYCEKDAQITVRFYRKREQAVVEVDDNGPGIPVNEQVKIFERFYRIPGGGEEGCGLGLPIVKEIISRHSGNITIINENSKKGTLFRIQIPMIRNI